MFGVIVLVAIAPFINAAAFSARIDRALEASLGRKVTFREAHFTLLFGPGFSLTDVTIAEDPRFGAEPFAFVPNLRAQVRLDRLLLGQIVFSSLRLVEPSLNLVRREDGSWNILELVQRLSRPTRVPLSLFPAFEISSARVDCKLGVRKTNVYLTDTDLSIYRQQSGKVYIQFSGSPARTDRAGNGFGHVRGTVNWYVHPAHEANQLEADLTLDRSNLSELSTLFQGEDSGVHGTISGHARIAGPSAALHVSGDMLIEDLHRWDLLPSSGEDWRVRYQGLADLPGRTVELTTIPLHPGDSTPVQLSLRGTSLLAHPIWSLLANLNDAPAAQLLPLARRMGLDLPDSLSLDGRISGAVGYVNQTGWQGGVSITNFVATLPKAPPFRAASVSASIDPTYVHFHPARIQTTDSGWLDLSGDYDRTGTHGLHLNLAMNDFPAGNLRDVFGTWFQAPPALDLFGSGTLTGSVNFDTANPDEPVWSGRFAFADARFAVPGLADPFAAARGQVTFNARTFDLDRFSATVGGHSVSGSLHTDLTGKQGSRVHLDVPAIDLAVLENEFAPALRPESLLARLGVTRRHAPNWLLQRNVQADVRIAELSVNGTPLGPLRCRGHWEGTLVHITSADLQMAQALLDGAGTINLAGISPRYNLIWNVSKLPWHGGLVSAEGTLDTSGTGTELFQRLTAQGTFSGQDLALSSDDSFGSVSGAFQLSFADGWPDLHATNIQADDGDDLWTGVAASQSDGKLILDLEHAGHQRRVVSALHFEPAPPLSSARALSTSP